MISPHACGFAASLPANSRDVAVRNGMDDLGTLFEFGPRVRGTLVRLSAGSRIRFDLPLRTVIEVNNGGRLAPGNSIGTLQVNSTLPGSTESLPPPQPARTASTQLAIASCSIFFRFNINQSLQFVRSGGCV